MRRAVGLICGSVGAAVVLALAETASPADWRSLRGSADHSGFVESTSKPFRAGPFRLAWAREFLNERLGTAMEPIIANGKVFVATHSGNLYACDALSGEPIWRFQAAGPFLHSPAVASNSFGAADGQVVTASTDGSIYCLAAASAKLRWMRFVSHGGFSASPLIVGNRVFIGSRMGDFLCLNLKDGSREWTFPCGAPQSLY